MPCCVVYTKYRVCVGWQKKESEWTYKIHTYMWLALNSVGSTAHCTSLYKLRVCCAPLDHLYVYICLSRALRANSFHYYHQPLLVYCLVQPVSALSDPTHAFLQSGFSFFHLPTHITDSDWFHKDTHQPTLNWQKQNKTVHQSRYYYIRIRMVITLNEFSFTRVGVL